MDDAGVFFTPVGILIAISWNFAVLASVQLTVRLIRAFSIWRTLLASVVLTAVTVPLTAVYSAMLGRSLMWMPAAALVTAIVAFLIVRRMLRFRRRRSAVAAAIGIGLLSAPWGALLVGPPG